MKNKGFTLIELMIVVVIIGILAAIAIPNFISMQDRAKEGSVKSNMHTLQLAVEDYAVQNVGNYCAHGGIFPVGGSTSEFDMDGDGDGDVTLHNPFDSGEEGLNWGFPSAAGIVSYDHEVYGSTPYTIMGRGKDGILQGAGGTTFIMSNQN